MLDEPSEMKWESIEKIRQHGADWCITYEWAMDDLRLSKLEGVVRRINEVIEAAFKAGAEQR